MINVLIGNNKELLDRFVSESKIEADSYIQSENLRDIKEAVQDGEICFFASFSDRQKLLDFIRFSHSLRCNVTVIHELENGNLKEYFFPAYSLFSLFIKRLFDITVSLAGIVIGLPIWTVICICCAFSSGGSVLKCKSARFPWCSEEWRRPRQPWGERNRFRPSVPVRQYRPDSCPDDVLRR